MSWLFGLARQLFHEKRELIDSPRFTPLPREQTSSEFRLGHLPPAATLYRNLNEPSDFEKAMQVEIVFIN